MENKQEELETMVQLGKYDQAGDDDLVAVTETWWDSSHGWNVVMDGYVLLWEDRPARQGGGVALYV